MSKPEARRRAGMRADDRQRPRQKSSQVKWDLATPRAHPSGLLLLKLPRRGGNAKQPLEGGVVLRFWGGIGVS